MFIISTSQCHIWQRRYMGEMGTCDCIVLLSANRLCQSSEAHLDDARLTVHYCSRLIWLLAFTCQGLLCIDMHQLPHYLYLVFWDQCKILHCLTTTVCCIQNGWFHYLKWGEIWRPVLFGFWSVLGLQVSLYRNPEQRLNENSPTMLALHWFQLL